MKSLILLSCIVCLILTNHVTARAAETSPGRAPFFVSDSTASTPKKTTMPVFRQGNIYNWVKRVMIYPKESRKRHIQGKVYVQFTINSQGKVVNPKVIRGINEELDREALRIVSKMPKWKPGYQNGKAVNVNYTLPINFSLN